MPLSDVDLVVLAGGRGTRLRSVVADVPKIMAPVGCQPFLELMLAWVRPFAPRRIVMSLGHMAGKVTEYLEGRKPCGLDIAWVIEPAPFGTAGGLRLAFEHATPGDVMALNGDTIAKLDLGALRRHHRARKAFITMGCVEVPCISRYGAVEVDGNRRISAFVEKGTGRSGPGLINAGIYCFSAEARQALGKAREASLEADFFPSCTPGRISVWSGQADFIDIGTPESYGEIVRQSGEPK
jgi:NDP-sugar pyrophosphorylase family protein